MVQFSVNSKQLLAEVPHLAVLIKISSVRLLNRHPPRKEIFSNSSGSNRVEICLEIWQVKLSSRNKHRPKEASVGVLSPAGVKLLLS